MFVKHFLEKDDSSEIKPVFSPLYDFKITTGKLN